MEEFFFFKIASVLKVGPKIENIFGFDLICYDDSIEFAMEFCQQSVDVEEDKNLKKELF